ncbi:sulfurtransferase [Jeotgalibacillus sp. S-D1]|uniref:sulfurtransferase n=1 Tax=Jeotgalibacillus sp. S-D1 TaxID=2552189 RepID=UPI00105A3480|nr:sulfurtransferase [Jeotgalibacillus sp. S-D1]TDL34779.1 sulfurtransferase [Jeotgalibacillus sp. S-D1]
MRHTVTAAWLVEKLDDPNVVIIDCRFSLQNPEQGKSDYEACHIPGAVYFHLNKDLSGVVKEHGGRHPLPETNDFKEKIQEAGVSDSSVVVVYDNGEGAFASRGWWLMRYFGHENVFVLNGGMKEWEAQKFPVDKELPRPERGKFDPSPQKHMIADVEEVKKIVAGKTTSILLDSRSYDRYIGQNEPIDRVAGHIPGAIHRDWVNGVEKGFFLKDEEQANRFSEWEKDRPIVVYCGSGVTATPNIIALNQAGFTNVKLYPGSYSDWVSYDENEIELGDSTNFEK